MFYYIVSPFVVVHQRQSELTYASNEPMVVGQVVTVSVGKKTVAGVVLRETTKPTFETKLLTTVVEGTVVPPQLIALHAWLCSFYASHPVAVWQTLLPSGITKKRRLTKTTSVKVERKRTHFVLNEQQKTAVDRILQRPKKTTLLHGITGSGKTAIYIELAKRTLEGGHSVIVLVPEIALTPQLVSEFTNHLPDVLVTHSQLTESQRHSIWLEALGSKKPRVIIGPRSALFTPLANLGLIVIDECHEPSYKQEKSPRYSALRAASILAKEHGASVVLGSATPSVQDYYLAQQRDKDAIVRLDQLARPSAVLPHIELVDMTVRSNFSRSVFLSSTLLTTIGSTLEAGHQSLLFHNRRGSAPITLCENCGWSASCPNCFTPLTLHSDRHLLRCHLCNHTERIPTACPSCNSASILHKGIGTKRVEEELRRLFPSANIARFDGDNESGDTVDKRYQALYDGSIDIIVGTQVVAKGLDLPHLRTVGVVQADSGLALPDYQSSERVFQLLAQVVGRVGRSEHETNVVLQTYQPSHSSVVHGIARDYDSFYSDTLSERRRAVFPPFCYLLKAVCMYKTEASAVRASRALATSLRPLLSPHASLLGPTPAFYERMRDSYRWQIIVKSPSRAELSALTEHIPPTHWQFELDPVSLL